MDAVIMRKTCDPFYWFDNEAMIKHGFLAIFTDGNFCSYGTTLNNYMYLNTIEIVSPPPAVLKIYSFIEIKRIT